MNWTKNKSLLLSRICVYVFAAAYFAVCCGTPWLNRIYWYTGLIFGKVQYLAVTVYVMALPIYTALWQMHRLLGNIAAQKVFVAQNVRALRIISWACIAAGVILLLSALYAVSFAVLAAAAFFLGVVLRVVKNVFEQAVALQTENDLTI